MTTPHNKLSRFRVTLQCVSITANCLAAGAVFVFPVMSPALAYLLKLSQPQLTTVALAGIIGQYPFSPIVGKVLDKHGPSTCSLISAGLFFLSFLSSSFLVSMTPRDIVEPSPWIFRCLTFFFLMAGLATVFSYFSSIFAASKNFPHHPGAAAGTSMALFGLSPLCLSLFASHWFTEVATGQLKIVPYLRFLALLTATTHLLGAFTLDLTEPTIPHEPEEANEATRLMPSKPDVDPSTGNYPDPIRDLYFWILGMYCLLSIGASEMVISNLGTIVLSLPPDPSSAFSGVTPPDVITANQVKIISISNTLSRLLVGPLADYVSPVASYLPCGAIVYRRKHRISRIVFLSGPILILGIAFLLMQLRVKSREAVWVLSVGTGINYGTVFTVLPSIVSSGWGAPDLGRNFGIMTYAPFIGTPLFSYLYAFISAASSRDPSAICEGTMCWRTTFWITCATCLVAFFGTLILWRHWRGKV